MDTKYFNSFLAAWMIGCAMLFSFSAYGSTVTGELLFEKKSPKAYLLVFVEDDSLSESGGSPVVDQVAKEFTKYIVVADVNGTVTFKNSDTISHNIYVNDNEAEANFDVGLAKPGTEIKKEVNWKENSIVRVNCKIHPKMRMYLANITSKYHTAGEIPKGQKSTTMSIGNVPDEYTKLMFWAPGYPVEHFTLKVGESKKIEFEKMNKVRGFLQLNRQ